MTLQKKQTWHGARLCLAGVALSIASFHIGFGGECANRGCDTGQCLWRDFSGTKVTFDSENMSGEGQTCLNEFWSDEEDLDDRYAYLTGTTVVVRARAADNDPDCTKSGKFVHWGPGGTNEGECSDDELDWINTFLTCASECRTET